MPRTDTIGLKLAHYSRHLEEAMLDVLHNQAISVLTDSVTHG
jgi:hypothetical protein